MRLRRTRESLFRWQIPIFKAHQYLEEAKAEVVMIHEKRYHVAADTERREGVFLMNRTNILISLK